ncbi:SDR family oxidoreductase [Pseudomonas sp. S31]|uniref:SDR family NAD(P)-dependent oxidoreductase n=1 Tax=Pseudomonas sp. S31 TaxID=1564473 RepID=UPI001913B73A|nr:SDR family oxidoreductase [Pseudomonas sp. S31]MBK5001938.1 SDR family oxidoreductase [Pseudomonas sp. S31]
MSGALAGKVALVTGGIGGIGRAVCERLIREGAVVYAADLSDGAPVVGARGARLDVSDETQVQALMQRVQQAHGRLDVLVNAAGIEVEQTIEHTSLEVWNKVFAVNVTGTFLVSKHALPLLRESTGASVINFGSYDGFIADPGLAAYCASKGAVHALTRAMACDHGPEGIRVNAVCPGYIDTPMLRSFFQGHGDIASLESAVRDVHPTRRYGTPEDVANLVYWLASDEARYASGQLWILDGGLTAQVQQMKL